MCGYVNDRYRRSGILWGGVTWQPGELRALRAHVLSLYRAQPGACREGLGPG